MSAPHLVKTDADMRAVLDDLRRRANDYPAVTVEGPDGLQHQLTARRWLSAQRRENPVRYFIDRRRASADTIVGIVIYDADTLDTSGNRTILREPTLRAAIAKATGNTS